VPFAPPNGAMLRCGFVTVRSRLTPGGGGGLNRADGEV
jgi:hypothetical protein